MTGYIPGHQEGQSSPLGAPQMTKSFAAVGNRNTAQRIINAENDFVETLVRCGEISAADARKVMSFYLKNKIAKLDAVIGRVSVQHGAFLEKDVIRRAIVA
jgi:predicted phage-related endonuclease